MSRVYSMLGLGGADSLCETASPFDLKLALSNLYNDMVFIPIQNALAWYDAKKKKKSLPVPVNL